MRRTQRPRLFNAKPLKTATDHLILIVGALFMCFPVAFAFWMTVAPTQGGLPVVEAAQQFQMIYGRLLSPEPVFSGMPTVLQMLFTSLVVALGFATITTLTSFLAAFSLVYFRLRFGLAILLAILVTLYFPIETRIMPTFLVIDAFGLLDTYAGLILPLTATGIATLLFTLTLRQMPEELTEAARLDGAGPRKFLIDILLPIQLPMIAAIFAILFALGWNQYLWPLIIATSNENLTTIVRGVGQLGGGGPYALGLGLIATIPPAIIGGIGLYHIQRGMIFEQR